MKIADVFFAAQLDDAGLQADASKAGDKAGKTLGASMSASLKQLGSAGFGLAGGQAAFGILKNVVGDVTAGLGDMIQKGSNLNETMSKVGVVFGSSAGDIDAWGETAARNLGMSKQAAEEAASTLGNLFQGAGVAGDQVTGLSKNVVQLAADLGSFNNIDSSVALEKLRAGLVGEAEPLRALGVNLTAATTDAKAAELGFKKVNGVFTEGQKIQARYALIVESTKNAQGDFARTADGLANKQKILNAQWDDMTAKIGRGLLPVVAAAAGALSDFFGLVTGETAHWIDQLGVVTATLLLQRPAYEMLQEQEQKLLQARKELLNNPFALQKDLDALDDMIAKVRALELATAATVPMFHDSSEAVKALNQAARDATPVLATNAGAIDTVTTAAEKAAPKLYDMFRQYTVAITRGDVAQDTLDLYDNAKAVTAARLAVEKATPGTAAYRRAQLELTVAQGHLAQSHERLIADQLTLFEIKPDKKTAAALDKYFQGLGKGILNLDDKAQDAYRSVQRLLHPATGDANVQIIIRYGGAPQKLAAGGPVKAGVPVIVGDAGRPELFVPDVNGRIVPEVPSSTAIHGSDGTVINNYVNVDGYMKVRDPFEIGSTLRRLADFGALTPRPEYG